MDLNNKTLLRKFKEDLGWDIDYITWWTYVKKKYVKPSSYLEDGKRIVPIYYESDFPYLVNVLRLLRKLGKVKIKGYDQDTIQKSLKRNKKK